jgi:hypothetical protein
MRSLYQDRLGTNIGKTPKLKCRFSYSHLLEGKKTHIFCAAILYSKVKLRSFYQDRLGTNIGKALKKSTQKRRVPFFFIFFSFFFFFFFFSAGMHPDNGLWPVYIDRSTGQFTGQETLRLFPPHPRCLETRSFDQDRLGTNIGAKQTQKTRLSLHRGAPGNVWRDGRFDVRVPAQGLAADGAPAETRVCLLCDDAVLCYKSEHLPRQARNNTGKVDNLTRRRGALAFLRVL